MFFHCAKNRKFSSHVRPNSSPIYTNDFLQSPLLQTKEELQIFTCPCLHLHCYTLFAINLFTPKEVPNLIRNQLSFGSLLKVLDGVGQGACKRDEFLVKLTAG